jgi:mRNA interferase MazF
MCERGDLLLVPFPFTDLSATKRRPVLALTTADSYGDFIALPVTSRPQAEHGLSIAPAHMISGQLPARAGFAPIASSRLNKTLVVKSIGPISDALVVKSIAAFSLYLST